MDKNGIIYIGNQHIYNPHICSNNQLKLRLKNTLNILAAELKKLGIQVLKPNKSKKTDMCYSLWTRDTSFLMNNNIFLIPHMLSIKNKIKSANRLMQVKSEVDVIPYKNEGIFVPDNVNIDGGDIIVDNNTIFVGKNERTDNSGVKFLIDNFKNKNVVPIAHHALHLDCCFAVLPGNIVLYSNKYIKRMPRIIRDKYNCIKIEDILTDGQETNLATNFLLIGNTILTADKPKFKKLHDFIQNLGFQIILIPFENISTMGGGVRCLTQWYKLPTKQQIY
jgi:N-dimethylarginine dimethylaminohydrolase